MYAEVLFRLKLADLYPPPFDYEKPSASYHYLQMYQISAFY